MSRYECDVAGCSKEYTVGEGEETDGRFLSISLSFHDLDRDDRAISVCEEHAREADRWLPEGSE